MSGSGFRAISISRGETAMPLTRPPRTARTADERGTAAMMALAALLAAASFWMRPVPVPPPTAALVDYGLAVAAALQAAE
jgi:hypothetical protein